MTVTANANDFITSYASSLTFRMFLQKRFAYQEHCLGQTRAMIEELCTHIEGFISSYDDARQQFNNTVTHPQELVHLTPYCRKNTRHGGEIYVAIVWAKFLSPNYRYTRSRDNRCNRLREIRPSRPGQYTERDLGAALNRHNIAALPLLLAAEHVMRFWRREYELLKTVRHTQKTYALSDYQLDLANTPDDYKKRLNGVSKRNKEDPFNLPKALSIVTFQSALEAAYIPADDFDDLDDTIPL